MTKERKSMSNRIRTFAPIVLAAMITALVVGGVALATIPSSGGVISGCYEKRTGLLRVIDTEAGKTCMSFETPISWNQQGPKGDPGSAGLAGPAGTDGAQGPAGTHGEAGLPGPQGEPGPTGPQGEPGPTGPQGEPGPTGPQGASGADGEDGTDGARGPTGPQGVDGERGATGAQGVRGEPGATGARGADGADGDRGERGPTGAEGPTGATGDRGPAGAGVFAHAQVSGLALSQAGRKNVASATYDSDAKEWYVRFETPPSAVSACVAVASALSVGLRTAGIGGWGADGVWVWVEDTQTTPNQLIPGSFALIVVCA
jgi:hypothetical protein